jgi:hypothetical protein
MKQSSTSSREIDTASLRQIEVWLNMCREDLCYALSEIREADGRIQGTIEMITRVLNDHEAFEKFRTRWNTPWENIPSDWA